MSNIDNALNNVLDSFSYVVETVHGSFRIFQTFTYGEMVISLLLMLILGVLLLIFFWAVIKW